MYKRRYGDTKDSCCTNEFIRTRMREAALSKAASICHGDEENCHRACTSNNLTTANQGEIRGSVSRLCKN